MITSNLFRKVDSSWLPFFYSYFQAKDKGQKLLQIYDYFSSKSLLFPKYFDLFKSFENISLKDTKIVFFDSASKPTPQYTNYPFQNVKDKQYVRPSELLIREMFRKDICEITEENLVARNILALNILPFASSESNGYGSNLRVDSYIPYKYFSDNIGDDFFKLLGRTSLVELLEDFYKELLTFIRTTNGGLIVLSHSGLTKSKLPQSTEFAYCINSFNSSLRYSYTSSNNPFDFIYTELYNKNNILPRRLDANAIGVKNLQEIGNNSTNFFLIDIFSFIDKLDEESVMYYTPENMKNFVAKNSNLNTFKLLVNFLIRKNFKNSNPIKW